MDRYTRLDRIHLHAADMYVDVLCQLGIEDRRNDGLQFETCPEWEQKADAFYKETAFHQIRSLSASILGALCRRNGGHRNALRTSPIISASKGIDACSLAVLWIWIWYMMQRRL